MSHFFIVAIVKICYHLRNSSERLELRNKEDYNPREKHNKCEQAGGRKAIQPKNKYKKHENCLIDRQSPRLRIKPYF